MTHRSRLALLLLIVFASCATPPSSRTLGELAPRERDGLLLVAADDARDPGCTVWLGPMPAVDELVDSASIHAELVRRWEATGEARGRTVVSIHSDTAGVMEWFDVLETDLPDSLASGLAEVFEGRLKPQTRSTSKGLRPVEWTHRVEVAFDSGPTMRVGPTVMCVPRLRNERRISQELVDVIMENPILRNYMQGPRRTTVLMYVAEDGTPNRIQVGRSSGFDILDRVALQVAEHARFDPAVRDGRRFSVPVHLPIDFRFPERERSSRGRP